MTPKEKAKYLLDKMSKQTYSFQEYAGAYYSTEEIGWEAGKKCAFISFEEKYNDIQNFIEYIRALKMISKENAEKIIIDMNKERYNILVELEKL